jgi:hypothetical protein
MRHAIEQEAAISDLSISAILFPTARRRTNLLAERSVHGAGKWAKATSISVLPPRCDRRAMLGACSLSGRSRNYRWKTGVMLVATTI